MGSKCLGLARSTSDGARRDGISGSGLSAKSGLLAAEAQPAAESGSDEEAPPDTALARCNNGGIRSAASRRPAAISRAPRSTCADTGASNCVISRRALSLLGLLGDVRDTRTTFYHANGAEERAKRKVRVVVCLPGLTRTVEMFCVRRRELRRAAG